MRTQKPLVLFTETPSWRRAAAAALDRSKPTDGETERRLALLQARMFRVFAEAAEKRRAK